MMMPANFSAISENEMTYVNGGASLADILAPSLEVKNWQKFNTNMVTIIGNSFLGKYVENTVGVLFDGAYKPGDLGNAWLTGVKGAYGTGYEAGFGKHENETAGDKFLNGGNGVLNAGLRMVGSAAAIYNLATGTVKNDVSEKAWKVEF
jgi:hypothetical protein